MRIIARRTLRDFIDRRSGQHDHRALKASIEAWFGEARAARWRSMADIKRLYRNASVVSSDRVVFNIRGNNYRLITAIDFEKGIVFIKWIGTHDDYDHIDARKVNHGD